MSFETTVMSDNSRKSLEVLLAKHNMTDNITQAFWNDFEVWLFSYLKQFVKSSLSGVLENILKKLNLNKRVDNCELEMSHDSEHDRIIH